MMVRILSIDCDYFIAASAQERDLYFPRGGDEIPTRCSPYGKHAISNILNLRT